MPFIFGRLRVSDLARWQDEFIAADAMRREYGLTLHAVYRDAVYHDGLIVVMHAEDLERAHDFYSSDQQRQRMTRSGIERPAEMWTANEFDFPIEKLKP